MSYAHAQGDCRALIRRGNDGGREVQFGICVGNDNCEARMPLAPLKAILHA